MYEWIKKLEVGNKVAIRENTMSSYVNYSIKTVKRITKTMIITSGYNNKELRFNKNGSLISDKGYFNRRSIQEVTDEVISANKLYKVKYNLEKSVELLREVKKEYISDYIEEFVDLTSKVLQLMEKNGRANERTETKS